MNPPQPVFGNCCVLDREQYQELIDDAIEFHNVLLEQSKKHLKTIDESEPYHAGVESLILRRMEKIQWLTYLRAYAAERTILSKSDRDELKDL
jgi:hypothetical protein